MIVEDDEKTVIEENIESPTVVPRSNPRQEQLVAEIAQHTLEIDTIKVLINGPNPRLEDRKSLKIKLDNVKVSVSAEAL